MGRVARLQSLLRASAVAVMVYGTTSYAQSNPPKILPADAMTLSPAGVDLRSGTFQENKTVLSIGDPQKGGIEFNRITRSYGENEPAGKLSQFDHNWNVRFRRSIYPNINYISVTSNNFSFNFVEPSTNYPADTVSNTSFATLQKMGSGNSAYFVLRVADGTVVTSRNMPSSGLAPAASIQRADGVKYTFNYDTLGPSGADRLRSVTSNAGYALLFEHISPGNDLVSKACVLNLTETTLPSGSCPAGATSVSYGYSAGALVSETDQFGKIWSFTDTSTAGQWQWQFEQTFTRPGESSPYMTLTYSYSYDIHQPAVTVQSFGDGRQYTYSWTSANTEEVAVGLQPMGYSDGVSSATVTIGAWRPNVYQPLKFTPGPETLVDGLGRQTTFDYCLQSCAKALLVSKTFPNGMKDSYQYDNYHNITQITRTPATGSSLTPTVTSATYDCATMVFCSKPTSVTDAKNNSYTYSYSSTHGQVLTETRPAVQVNGTGPLVAPVTRYEYTARNAWVSNGAGGYVQVVDPIHLLTAERTCRTTATVGNACAGGSADEVVITYDYGPNAGPNNLLLRGKVVTATDGGVTTSLRTCFGYDAKGNKIWETTPRAGLASCS